MEISQLILAKLWLYAFTLGAELGAVYDVLFVTRVFLGVPFSPRVAKRIASSDSRLLAPLRMRERPLLKCVICFLEDLLFSLFAAVSIILLFYGWNDGIVRIPAIFCTALGFFGYRATLGKLLRPTLELLCVCISNLILVTLQFLTSPLRAAFAALRAFLLRCLRKCLRLWERKQRKRFTQAQARGIGKNACGLL